MFYEVKIIGSRYYRFTYDVPVPDWYTSDICLDGLRSISEETLSFFCKTRAQAEMCLDVQMGKLYLLMSRGHKSIPFRGRRDYYNVRPLKLTAHELFGAIESCPRKNYFLACRYNAEIAEYPGELSGDIEKSWPDIETMYVAKC